MRYNIVIGLMCVFVISASCSKDPTSNTSNYNVSGTVYYKDQKIPDVPVSLYKNEEIYKSTKTDTNGYFEFIDIPSGEYKLIAYKSFGDSAFVENPIELSVEKDVYLENLELPEPVVLYPPLEITDESVTLHWSPYSLDNFYEYKVFRHKNTALDENTGTLVHIATSIQDTVFIDEGLGRGNTCYYRVYVNNNFGRLAGSNILTVTTKEWPNEEELYVRYNLEQVSNFDGYAGIVSGIDFDGEFLWFVSLQEVGGYYDHNYVTLIQYDHLSGDIMRSFDFKDEFDKPMGITWDGNSIWLNYGNTGTGTKKIKKIDPFSGTILNTYSTGYGIQDLTYDGRDLLFCYYFNLIEKCNINNLGVIETFKNPFGGGANFGITHRPGEIWLSNKGNNQLAIIDEQGTHIGLANTDLLSDWNGYNSHLHLCFMNDNLVMVKNSRIYILEIQSGH